MGLWAGRRRQGLVHDLRSHMRLLLPEDPGRERMVELVRLFDPAARPAGAGRICVDAERRIYLTRPSMVDPGIAAEAQAPPGLPVAYFVQVQGRSAPLDLSGLQREKRELQETAILLLNGLAIRLGGFAWPPPKVASEPLQVTVYMPGPYAAAEIFSLAAGYIPGLFPEENVTLGSAGASAWRTAGGEFRMEFWPRKAALVTIDPPVSLGDWQFHPENLSLAVLRLASPASQADPVTARTVGQTALAVAAATGGVCVDPLKFRVRQPDDLVMR